MLYSTPTDISARTTHDLWVESRQLEIALDRPSATTIRVTVRYPLTLEIVDGLVVLLSTKPISAVNYPADGTQYTASTDFTAPADQIPSSGGAQVVAFYSGALNLPIPTDQVTADEKYNYFQITITNTVASQLYYASVHGSTNVLQYYPIGVQSYPLETSQLSKDTSSYTGNIPSLPAAPTNPTVGMVYFDQQLNVVQYWTGSQWIPTRADVIPSGAYNPGILGQVYFFTGANKFQVFDGKKWVEASSTNFNVRVGATFVPIANQSGAIQAPDSPVIGDFYYDYTTQRAQYWDGTSWIYPTSSNTLFQAPPVITPAFTTSLTIEPAKLPDPVIGELFYNTTQKDLLAWDGTAWNKVNTDQTGTPSTDKIAIGTDGSYDERVRLIKVLQGQLGWPQYCVELQEEQFNIAIDNALDTYRQLSGGAYKMRYIIFYLRENQQTYYLNSPLDLTDHIVDVSKIHRFAYNAWLPSTGPQDTWSQAFAQQYLSLTVPASGSLLSAALAAQYSEQLELQFAGNYTFLWDEASRELFLTRRVASNEKVIIEAFMERTEQEIINDRWAKQFIQNWALAEAKMTLGMIRSKYSSGTPGAQGTITLNGELLISEARQDMTELKEGLLNYEYGGLVNQGNPAFLIG